MIKNCLKCGKEFSKSIFCSNKEWKIRLYCSHSCANSVNSLGCKRSLGKPAWNKGLKFGKSPKNTRIEKECLECGEKFIIQKYRGETAKFCSKKCSSENKNKGKRTENKIARQSKEFKIWRELVFERDDWTCQCCGERGYELNPHHILNFSDNEDLRFDTNNGITFCRECHYKFHSEYGFNNNNQSQIDKFLSVSVEA